MPPGIRILVFILFLGSNLHSQWLEVQLDEDDMAADLAEALTFTKYPTYPQYVEMMQHFADSFPEICRLDTFGISSQGRLLLTVKISDQVERDEAEASFFYTSSMHGDELVGYPLMLRLISYLLEGYGEDEEVNRLVDELEIWINPLANPDGTYYPDDDLSVFQSRRETAGGVDMNREFPDPDAGDAVNDTVGRAKETRAMMAFLQKQRFNLSANIHSGAEVVNYPWDRTYDLHADDDWFRFVAREYADEARAVDPAYMSLFEDGITNGAQWYRIKGGRQDYVTYYLEGREITLELYNDYRIDSERLDEFWMKNKRSFLNFMAQGLYGIRGRITDAESGAPLEALVEIPGLDQDYSHVHSSSVHGDFYRLLREGSYELVVSAPGYINDTIPMVQVKDYQASILDVELEALIKSIEPDKGERTLYIYPNPAREYCFIYPEIDRGQRVQVSVFNINGRMMMEKSLDYKGQGIRVSTADWPEGMYVLRCLSEKTSSIAKLIIH